MPFSATADRCPRRLEIIADTLLPEAPPPTRAQPPTAVESTVPRRRSSPELPEQGIVASATGEGVVTLATVERVGALVAVYEVYQRPKTRSSPSPDSTCRCGATVWRSVPAPVLIGRYHRCPRWCYHRRRRMSSLPDPPTMLFQPSPTVVRSSPCPPSTSFTTTGTPGVVTAAPAHGYDRSDGNYIVARATVDVASPRPVVTVVSGATIDLSSIPTETRRCLRRVDDVPLVFPIFMSSFPHAHVYGVDPTDYRCRRRSSCPQYGIIVTALDFNALSTIPPTTHHRWRRARFVDSSSRARPCELPRRSKEPALVQLRVMFPNARFHLGQPVVTGATIEVVVEPVARAADGRRSTTRRRAVRPVAGQKIVALATCVRRLPRRRRGAEGARFPFRHRCGRIPRRRSHGRWRRPTSTSSLPAPPSSQSRHCRRGWYPCPRHQRCCVPRPRASCHCHRRLSSCSSRCPRPTCRRRHRHRANCTRDPSG